MSTTDDRKALLDAVRLGIEANPANSAKWKSLKKWFLDRFSLEELPGSQTAEGKNITSENQVWNRIHNELVGRDPKYAVITAVDQKLLPHIQKHLKNTQYPRARAFLLLDGLTPYELQVYQPDDVTATLEEIFPELTPVYIQRPEHQAPQGGSHDLPSNPAVVPIAVDDRIARMVILAIRSSHAVILVGPPGTGKTTLLQQVVALIQDDPAAYGFSTVNEPLMTTPEESWTTMDLLGGQTLAEGGELRFRPGLVLESIAEDRWLILDEANRADLDRIFGGLLTWLSIDTDIDLGPVSTNVSADRVVLGWADGDASCVHNQGALDASKPTGKPVRYLAGNHWRLLGTYNAADAQRVFRWGQALGRRFSRVPVPPPTPDDFATTILPLTQNLPDEAHTGIVGLYAAHYSLPVARVGPALFMQVPRYVEQGLGGQEVSDQLITELLAEGYLIMAGTHLSRLRPEDLAAVGDEVVNKREIFDESQWDWIVDKVGMLG